MKMNISAGFVCAVFSIANCYRNVKNSTDFEEFSTFDNTLVSMTWTLFDIYGYDVRKTINSTHTR